ncbi:Heat shock 70 kDa protein 12A [Stylophora pistillata]|uniref:Heat shock 70 kDa protein 12A n=1 Tax=Stylophora pistillata TaxID=50429 RepID=A0A2B4RFU1_STYPI|nr:Heat shock 70 kDa protein 12A [Stylophora pistillata]
MLNLSLRISYALDPTIFEGERSLITHQVSGPNQAKIVFARSINFLKDEAIKVIRQRTGDDHFSADDIQWVLTVPVIWTPRAKQFMREAAYEAGVGSAGNADQLMIALEPEAAAIFCKEKNMNDFQEESGNRFLDGVLSQTNTHYIKQQTYEIHTYELA